MSSEHDLQDLETVLDEIEKKTITKKNQIEKSSSKILNLGKQGMKFLIELRNKNKEFIERYTAITDSDCLPAYSYMATNQQSNKDLSSLDILLTPSLDALLKPKHNLNPVIFIHECRGYNESGVPDENGFLRAESETHTQKLLTVYLGEYIREEGGLSKFKNIVLETIRKNVKSKTDQWYSEKRALCELDIDRIPATNIRKEE